jgi:rhamnulokinase
MGLWLVQECRRAFEIAGRHYDYATLTRLAADCAPCRTLINPNHAPFGSPGKMPEKIADYARATQQPVPETDGAIVRACLDSLALEYARTLAGLERVAGRTLNTVHIVGGGTQNKLLNQLTADACQRTVIAGPIEATALGNILVQMIACGALPDLASARRLIRTSFPVETFTPYPNAPISSSMNRYLRIVNAD